MRFNKGGSSQQGTAFIKKLSKTKLNRQGKIYVIVGRRTFSAAVINTFDFLENTDALIVGEGTGGRPNHFGAVKRFVLPESNLVVNYSTQYFKLTENDSPSIQPDIEVSLHFKDFINGVDTSLEAVRNH